MPYLSKFYTTALKYSAEDEERAFHQAIHEHPQETTPIMAYADWLEEHDRPGEAAVFRSVVERSNDMQEYMKNTHGNTTSPIVNLFYNRNEGKRVSVRYHHEALPHTQSLVSVEIPSLFDPTKVLYAQAWIAPHSAAKETVEDLRKNGYSLLGVDHTTHYHGDISNEEHGAKLMGLPQRPREQN